MIISVLVGFVLPMRLISVILLCEEQCSCISDMLVLIEMPWITPRCWFGLGGCCLFLLVITVVVRV